MPRPVLDRFGHVVDIDHFVAGEIGDALLDLGRLHYATGDFASSAQFYDQAVEHAEEAGLRQQRLIALRNRQRILARNCRIIDDNLLLLDAFFARYPQLFEWRVSDGSCMAFPRYLGADGVEVFTRRLVEEAGVLLLPGSVYASELGPTPTDRFRIGFGRADIEQGLAAMDAWLAAAA